MTRTIGICSRFLSFSSTSSKSLVNPSHLYIIQGYSRLHVLFPGRWSTLVKKGCSAAQISRHWKVSACLDMFRLFTVYICIYLHDPLISFVSRAHLIVLNRNRAKPISSGITSVLNTVLPLTQIDTLWTKFNHSSKKKIWPRSCAVNLCHTWQFFSNQDVSGIIRVLSTKFPPPRRVAVKSYRCQSLPIASRFSIILESGSECFSLRCFHYISII